MQQVINDTKKIFDEKSEVTFGGWSRSPLFEYNKEDYSQQNKLCEKDSYYITNNEMGFYLEVSTQGVDLAIKTVFVNFKTGRITEDYVSKKILINPVRLPNSDTSGEFSYKDKRIALTITNSIEGRYIKCDFIDFGNYKNLYVKVLVKKETGDSMNIVAPFEKSRRNFYFKKFDPMYTADGIIKFGGTEYEIAENDFYVFYSCTRCALPRHQKYQTLTGMFNIGQHKISINLSSRVGDNKKGSENCFFIDTHLLKIGKIKVGGDEKRTDKQWYFTSPSDSMNLTFTPINNDGALLSCRCEKDVIVFGTLNGYIVDETVGKVNFKNKPVHMIFTAL